MAKKRKPKKATKTNKRKPARKRNDEDYGPSPKPLGPLDPKIGLG